MRTMKTKNDDAFKFFPLPQTPTSGNSFLRSWDKRTPMCSKTCTTQTPIDGIGESKPHMRNFLAAILAIGGGSKTLLSSLRNFLGKERIVPFERGFWSLSKLPTPKPSRAGAGPSGG